ncbi:hypothetical protein [Nonomuraea sp. NPDC005501]|uniref:hypothetical protein n=1 Tax=Nonomuraea sp. NPDC005501 TaxID=3156884 RepID=UPI0033B5DB20
MNQFGLTLVSRMSALGHMTKQRWNAAEQWVWSAVITHEALVTPEEFQQAQEILSGRGRGPTEHKPHRTRRPYALRGVLFCGRRMQGNWNHCQPYYRCRYPAEYALANDVNHPKTVYLKEADVLPSLDSWLAMEFGKRRLEETVRGLTDLGQGPMDAGADALHLKIAGCNRKLARHRAALEAGRIPHSSPSGWRRRRHSERAHKRSCDR